MDVGAEWEEAEWKESEQEEDILRTRSRWEKVEEEKGAET